MVMHGPTLGDTQHAQHYDNGVQSKRAGLSGLPRMTLILHARVSFCSAESQPSTSSPRLPESTAHGPFVGAAASTSNTAMKIQHPARTSSASSVPKYPPGKRAPPRRSILAPAGARFRQPPWSRPLSAAPPPPPTKTTSHNPPQSTPSLKSLPEPSMRLRRGLTSGRTQPVSDLVESPQPPPTRRPRPTRDPPAALRSPSLLPLAEEDGEMEPPFRSPTEADLEQPSVVAAVRILLPTPPLVSSPLNTSGAPSKRNSSTTLPDASFPPPPPCAQPSPPPTEPLLQPSRSWPSPAFPPMRPMPA